MAVFHSKMGHVRVMPSARSLPLTEVERPRNVSKEE